MSTLLSEAIVKSTEPAQTYKVVKPESKEVKPKQVVLNPDRRLDGGEELDVIAMFKQVEPLVKSYEETLKTKMLDAEAKYADGTALGMAELRASKTSDTINPLKFYNLCRERHLTVEDIMGCITVAQGKALELLSKQDLKSVSVPSTVQKSPSLYVTPRKGQEVPSAAEALFILSNHFRSLEEGSLEVSPLKIAGE